MADDEQDLGNVMFVRPDGPPHLVGAELCVCCASTPSENYPRPCLRHCEGRVHSELVGVAIATRCDTCGKEEL